MVLNAWYGKLFCISLTGNFYRENIPPTAMNNEFLTQTVRDNTKIIDSNNVWNLSTRLKLMESTSARPKWKHHFPIVTTLS